ncbi:DHHA1 domain-containing protein [Paenibacillus mesotrionivorans]|uniref:DHHA1 domain-containing protein n=1 Tax=Paenibacillus mesotrionivorans TaxID=3160968 RepID=A0ACC7NTE3_9BACL
MFQHSGRAWSDFFGEFIEYACLGTMADLMQLQGENRIIAKLGMMKLKQTPSPVFRELTRQLFVRSFTCDTIYYKIAPIFNAIGPIDDPNKAVQLLLVSASDERTIADLISYNERRKVITADQFFLVDARIQSQNLHENQVIVVQGELHEGIIEILASRITEKYKKPSIVITQEGKGSARSVPNSGFSIIETIKRASGNLKSFGGHQAAAGLSIEVERLSAFRYEIQQSALLEPAIRPSITFDHEINIDQFQDEMYEDLFLLEPFGNGNRKPVYYSKDTIITKWKPFGKQDAHMNIKTKKNKAILFYHNNQFNALPDQRIDFLYKPSFNHNKKEFIVTEYC